MLLIKRAIKKGGEKMAYTIEKAVIADWPALLNVLDKSLRSIPQYESFDDEGWKTLYQGLMTHSFPLYDIYKYVENGKICGFVCYYQHKLEMLYVLPEHMNRGIGTTLVRYILDNYKETMDIGVNKTNPVSRHIYEKHGFVIYGEEDYDVTGVYSPHYLMRREYKA